MVEKPYCKPFCRAEAVQKVGYYYHIFALTARSGRRPSLSQEDEINDEREDKSAAEEPRDTERAEKSEHGFDGLE
jgi:hypothetical protein